jgi:hypothetical protein
VETEASLYFQSCNIDTINFHDQKVIQSKDKYLKQKTTNFSKDMV